MKRIGGKRDKKMIDLYLKYRLLVFSLLLFICLFSSVYSYIGYKKGKYNQLYYTYGHVLLSMGLVITLMKIILGMSRMFFPIATFAILGFILVTIGEIKERRRNKPYSSE